MYIYTATPLNICFAKSVPLFLGWKITKSAIHNLQEQGKNLYDLLPNAVQIIVDVHGLHIPSGKVNFTRYYTRSVKDAADYWAKFLQISKGKDEFLLKLRKLWTYVGLISEQKIPLPSATEARKASVL